MSRVVLVTGGAGFISSHLHSAPELRRIPDTGLVQLRVSVEPFATPSGQVVDHNHALAGAQRADRLAGVVNVGSGRSWSVGELVEECGRVLGHSVDVETEQARVRTRDRGELVADSRLLREVTGWRPR